VPRIAPSHEHAAYQHLQSILSVVDRYEPPSMKSDDFGQAILDLASRCPCWTDYLRPIDATRVPCGTARQTVRHSELAGERGEGRAPATARPMGLGLPDGGVTMQSHIMRQSERLSPNS
jgi:hypothetical protein